MPQFSHPPRQAARRAAPGGAGAARPGAPQYRLPAGGLRRARRRDHRHVRAARGRRAVRGGAATRWWARTASTPRCARSFYPDEGPPTWSGIMLWRGATDWPVYQDGRTMVIAGGNAREVRVLPDPPRPGAARPAADQLGDHGAHRRRLEAAAAARGLEPAGPARRGAALRARPFPARLRRSGGADRGDRHVLRIPDLRPRPAAPLELWPRDAARRCGAPDVSGGQQRREPGGPGRARARPPPGIGRAGVRGARRLRRRAPAGDRRDRADQPRAAARRA